LLARHFSPFEPEIRLGMMLGDYHIVLLPIWVGRRLSHPEGRWCGNCFLATSRGCSQSASLARLRERLNKGWSWGKEAWRFAQ
jgi:hypothetical protein